MHDTSRHMVRTPEQLARGIQIPAPQGLADTRATDPVAVNIECMHIDDLKTMLFAGTLQHAQITLTPVAETEIVTDDQAANAQLTDQQLLNKLFGAEPGKGFIEMQTQNPVNGVMLQ